MAPDYGTASPSYVVDAHGRHRPDDLRHAVRMDQLGQTVCGIPIGRMVGLFFELDFTEDGELPPRCPECVTLMD